MTKKHRTIGVPKGGVIIMGAKGPEDLRSCRIQVRFSPHEVAEIHRLAEIEDVEPGRWLRRAALARMLESQAAELRAEREAGKR